MPDANASRRIGSAARGFSRALVAWTPAVLGCAVLLVAGAHRAEAGINVWTSHGPPGGLVLALAVDPTTPEVLYAGSRYSGVYKSIDAGSTWSFANLSSTYVAALAIDPTAPTTLYAGTPGGVFKSTDGAATWNATGLTHTGVTALVIDPTMPGTLYAATISCGEESIICPVGLYKSTDGGGTWSDTGLSSSFVGALAIDPAAPGTLYAATASSCSIIAGCFHEVHSRECRGG